MLNMMNDHGFLFFLRFLLSFLRFRICSFFTPFVSSLIRLLIDIRLSLNYLWRRSLNYKFFLGVFSIRVIIIRRWLDCINWRRGRHNHFFWRVLSVGAIIVSGGSLNGMRRRAIHWRWW